MTAILYGIPNCDTVKKARVWMEGQGLTYTFHDYKKAGADEVRLRSWVDRVGWEKLLNRAGTTFRKLPEADKADLNADKAVALMLAQPSMIKRPVLEAGNVVLVGFKPAEWASALKQVLPLHPIRMAAATIS
ncbi:ArsC family reductase [Brevundimonas sp.]|uniref:ArsC family reductase n=1 Tax=Brevundimonas sp. TaxID=1871086 RepID=UPI0035129A30